MIGRTEDCARSIVRSKGCRFIKFFRRTSLNRALSFKDLWSSSKQIVISRHGEITGHEVSQTCFI